MNLKIGILLARSDMFPGLGLDLMNGLKLALSNDQRALPTFVIEGVGNAADEVVIKTAEKLILQENVEILIGFCSIPRMHQMKSICEGYKKPFIHIDLGGSMLKTESLSPYIISHTLAFCQSTFLAGSYAAKHFGKKAMVASSFYDGGYQLTDNMVRGFTEDGGTIEKYFIAPMDFKKENFDQLIDEIESVQPEVLFLFFSYKEGLDVMNALKNSKLNGSIPIVAIPSLTDETINIENHKIENVYSMASWSFDDENPHMINFKSTYTKEYLSDPNIISLLGYEVGQTLSHLITDQDKIDPAIAKTVQELHYKSPRGNLTFSTMNESVVDTFKLRKFQFNNTKYHNKVIQTFNTNFSDELYAVYESIPFTGWRNPYLCT